MGLEEKRGCQHLWPPLPSPADTTSKAQASPVGPQEQTHSTGTPFPNRTMGVSVSLRRNCHLEENTNHIHSTKRGVDRGSQSCLRAWKGCLSLSLPKGQPGSHRA